MANQVIIPSYGASPQGAASPQPKSNPYATGAPPEGPLTAIIAFTIPAGSTRSIQNTDVSQYGMSMVQSMLVSNVLSNVSMTVIAGDPMTAVPFGIPATGTQTIPVFQKGTLLRIQVDLASLALAPDGITQIDTVVVCQIFNTFQPPNSWVSQLSVAGDVNIATINGTIDVMVRNGNLLGVSLSGQPFGGCKVKQVSTMVNAVQQISTNANGCTFKGLDGLNLGASPLPYVQIFDAPTPGAVVLGTTLPLAAYLFIAGAAYQVPPEGVAIQYGLMAAFTLTARGAGAAATGWTGNFYYA